MTTEACVPKVYKFLFFAGGTTFGGFESVTLTLMKELQRQGHMCFAIISGWSNGIYPHMVEEAGIPNSCLKIGRLYLSKPSWTLETLRRLPKAQRELRRIISDFRPDVIVLPSIELALVLTYLVPKSIPIVLHLHELLHKNYSTYFWRFALRRISGCITVSHFLKNRLSTSNLKGLRVRTVYNGTDFVLNSRHKRSASACFNVGIIGRITRQKRHHILIEALRLIDDEIRRQFSLSVIGSVESVAYERELKELIKEYSLEDHVKWLGFMRDPGLIYSGLDLVAAPAVDEAFGLTLIEAAAWGVPFIVSRSGAFPELIQAGLAGDSFETDDPRDLSRYLVHYFSEHQALKSTDVSGVIKENFSTASMAKAFLSTLTDWNILM